MFSEMLSLRRPTVANCDHVILIHYSTYNKIKTLYGQNLDKKQQESPQGEDITLP